MVPEVVDLTPPSENGYPYIYTVARARRGIRRDFDPFWTLFGSKGGRVLTPVLEGSKQVLQNQGGVAMDSVIGPKSLCCRHD